MARYSSTLNKFVRGDDVAPVPSASRAASGNSGWLSCEEYSTMVLTLAITVDNLTTLDVVVETADDMAGTNPRAVTGSPFAQQTVVSSTRKTFSGFDTAYRVTWTLVGTSGTFSVTGYAK